MSAKRRISKILGMLVVVGCVGQMGGTSEPGSPLPYYRGTPEECRTTEDARRST